jgi:hypothetical protein
MAAPCWRRGSPPHFWDDCEPLPISVGQTVRIASERAVFQMVARDESVGRLENSRSEHVPVRQGAVVAMFSP